MTKAEKLEEQISKLSRNEQLDLAYRVLERNTPPNEYPLTQELRETLQQRLKTAREKPEESLQWDQVKADLLREL